jgi:hypothetical protein
VGMSCGCAMDERPATQDISPKWEWGKSKGYNLKGIVYYGNNHYTSYIVSEDNTVWYHDVGTNMSRHMSFSMLVKCQFAI